MITLDVKKILHTARGKTELNINLEINKGEFITLYGASGSGKTTLLKIIAGLISPDEGTIKAGNQIWYNTNTNLSPQKRNTGMVFQDYALFPHFTVKQNLEYALKKGQQHTIVNELISMMELDSLQHKNPLQLSGGQQQRVALARALANQPQLLLLDEPLSALDYSMRQKLQDNLLHFHQKNGLTTILVSHEPGEIIKLSDHIFEIEEGLIKKHHSPKDFFGNHKTSAKFSFVGEILQIEKEDVVFILTILIGKETVKIIADRDEATNLAPGDKVTVGSKAFNPIIQKL